MIINCFTLYRMDKDGSLNISFNEWRDFLLYAPSTNIHELILYWRHSRVSDIFNTISIMYNDKFFICVWSRFFKFITERCNFSPELKFKRI